MVFTLRGNPLVCTRIGLLAHFLFAQGLSSSQAFYKPKDEFYNINLKKLVFFSWDKFFLKKILLFTNKGSTAFEFFLSCLINQIGRSLVPKHWI